MQIRLVPPSPHPTILYCLTFPNVLPLHQLGPGATIPPAWSSQLQLLTSLLYLEPPSSIHMLDRAVGLVARVRHLSMDVPQKEFTVKFVDEREINVPMNSDCVRMLLSVVDDVQGCSELESRRDSVEGSASPGSIAGSMEDLPPAGGPTKSPRTGKHKRQRSLLFSLISSLVPKSLSSPPRSPTRPSGAPPPAPLPSLPVVGRVTPPPSPQQAGFPSTQAGFPSTQADFLRRRARATLIDVWRRHVIPALASQHLPAAGYVEWTLIALASKARAEIESIETAKSHGCGISGTTRICGGRHKKTQSEGRKALDFGDRSDHCELEQWRYRAPPPFLDMSSGEDTDQVVYPRRQQADEWGVRYVHHPRFSDEIDVFAVEYNGHNDSLLGEHFTIGDDWDDNEPLAFQLGRVGRHDIPSVDSRSSTADDRHLHLDDFPLDCDSDDCGRLVDMAFDMSRCPLTPSDINDDEGSDDSQTSLRTPEDGEVLPLAPLAHVLQDAPQSALVSRASSFRPRSRNASSQFSNAPSKVSHPPAPSSKLCTTDCRDTHAGEYIASHLDYLERICTALEAVRSRAREEGWRLVRATLIGAKNGWMDAETERSLEVKSKRRAWSSGIKIAAVYPTPRSAPKVWDGRLSTLGSRTRPPGLNSPTRRVPRVRGPIVPTGLSLGIPLRSSPLAMYVWSADDGKKPTRSKYGLLDSARGPEMIEGKRTSRISFADSVTKLFPVCEEEGEVTFEPVQANAVGFPQAVPLSVTTEEHEYDLMEGLAENEDDLSYFCPPRPQPRVRTTSMHPNLPTSSVPSTPVLPMFRPSTPPPSYRATVGEDVPTAANDKEGAQGQGGLDTSALLLRPLSSLSVSSSQPPSSRHSFTSNPSFAPRPRSVSLPTPKSYSGANKTRRTSFHHKDEHCEDLSQAYASPPPEGPLVVSATPAPHEQYPRYAHIYSPTPASKKSMNTPILGRSGKEVVFEQAGSEFTVGIEVALGRAEEGRIVW